MLQLTVLILLLSIFAQIGAVFFALLQFGRIGAHRVAWSCVVVALTLMVQRRYAPLELALSTGLFDFSAALIALIISICMCAGMFGLRRHFVEVLGQRIHLENLAATDHLTGLHNRRRLFERAEEEIQRSQRSGEPLAVFMLDLDRFKAVNDQYGHAIGDAMLVAVAEALRATLRRVDIAGRLGGEEFAVLLPNTDPDAAAVAAERLRAAIAEAHPDRHCSDISVTTSIGVAVAERIPVTAEAPDYLRHLLQEADTALYIAKERGRNRVEFWSPEMAIQGS